MENLLKSKRLEKGMTLEEVGNKVGVGKSTVRKWENGLIENMGRDKIVALAKTLEISPLEILGVDTENNTLDIAPIYNQLNKDNQIEVYDFAEAKLKEQNMINEPKLTSIPVALKVAASCNTNGYGNDNDTADFDEVFTDREDLRNFDYAYYVYGDSMEPEYKNYDVVLTQRAYDVDNGSIYVVMHNEELFIKQVRINDGIFTMHSLNPKYKDINIQLDDAESYPVIIGKVVDSITPLQLN